MNNSGEDNNELYNNLLDSLYTGVIAQNANRNKNGSSGLQIKCNDFSNCYYDISVTAEEPGETMGIAYNQGSGEALSTAPANNTFSYTHNNSESDYNNDCNNVIYWHLTDTTTANTKPKYHSVPEVDTQYNELNEYQYIKDSCCPYTYGIGGGGSLEENKSLKAIFELRRDSLNSLLKILVDGGDTYQLATEIQTSSPEDSAQLSESLLYYSPYLSDSVMIKSIARDIVITPGMLTSILSENPQAAKSTLVQQSLDNRTAPLTEDQRLEIDQGWFITGSKERMEAELSGFAARRTKAFDNLIRIFKNDTLIAYSKDSVIALLNNENFIDSYYHQSLEYLHSGDTLNARVILSVIPQNYYFSEEKFIEFQQYTDFIEELIHSRAFHGLFSFDSSGVTLFNSLASQGVGQIKAMARNLLFMSDLLTYHEPYLLPNNGLKSDKIKRIPVRMIVPENSFSLYPNPAKDYVMINYSLAGPFLEGILSVIDLSGKLIQIITVIKSKDYLILPTYDLPGGVYIVQLHCDNSPILSKKLIIIKN